MLTTEFLEIASAICPDRPAVIFEGRKTSFSELSDRVQRLAVALRGLGVGPGDTVALIQVNTPHCIEAYFASALLGAIYVPLNFRARPNEFEYMINTADAKVVLAGERYTAVVDGLRPQLTSVRHFVALDGPAEGWAHYDAMIDACESEFIFPDFPEEATTILMYTAGTTGFPKGVMLHHGSFTSYVLNNVSPVETTVVPPSGVGR
ncbi:MAG: AMP-binding protein, partial [Chloroflexota bacterium]